MNALEKSGPNNDSSFSTEEKQAFSLPLKDIVILLGMILWAKVSDSLKTRGNAARMSIDDQLDGAGHFNSGSAGLTRR